MSITSIQSGIQNERHIPDELQITNDTQEVIIIDNVKYNSNAVASIKTNDSGLLQIQNQSGEIIAIIQYPVYTHGVIAEVWIIWSYKISELRRNTTV